MTEEVSRIFNFILELDKLKSILRKTKPLGANRYENSAEHSWQVCLLAQMLAHLSSPPVDIVRVIELLLVHDIPEIHAGDRLVYQRTTDKRKAAERLAALRIFGLLPPPQADWCFSRWEEFEARQSNEAVFAYAIDRLMPVLQNLHNAGQSWKENNVPFEKILKVNSEIGNALPAVWSYVESMMVKFFEDSNAEEHVQDCTISFVAR